VSLNKLRIRNYLQLINWQVIDGRILETNFMINIIKAMFLSNMIKAMFLSNMIGLYFP